MRRKRAIGQGQAGVVALEYAMTAVVFVGLVAKIWIFYEDFVQRNLYGGQGRLLKDRPVGVVEGDKSIGLEKVVSLPFP